MTIAQFIDSLDRLDALILLEDIIGHDRAYLLAHDEDELTDHQLAWLEPRAARRRAGEPLAYIRGHVEFYGRDFDVTTSTLVPRPESEDIIELLKTLQPQTICDVGTGSGALGITAALEIPGSSVTLLDVSQDALDVARRNAERLNAPVMYLKSDLLAETREHFDVLLANLPYVPDGHPINRGAEFEPPLALYGGPDGLDLYRLLFQEARATYIITEAMPEQHGALAAIGTFTLLQTKGYAQLFRCQ